MLSFHSINVAIFSNLNEVMKSSVLGFHTHTHTSSCLGYCDIFYFAGLN